MKTFGRISLFAGLASLTACITDPPPAPPAPPPPSALNSADSSFIQQAANSNLVEIALGQAAATDAGSAAVRAYAATQVKDHTAAEEQLASIASANSVTLPTTPDAAGQKIVTAVSAERGAQFDSAYLSTVTTQHEEAIRIATQAAYTSGSNSDVRSYALDMQSSAKTHLAEAQKLQHPTGTTRRHGRRR